MTCERYYSEEESAYLLAVSRYQIEFRKRWLTACDYLHIAKQMGYTLPGAETQ